MSLPTKCDCPPMYPISVKWHPHQSCYKSQKPRIYPAHLPHPHFPQYLIHNQSCQFYLLNPFHIGSVSPPNNCNHFLNLISLLPFPPPSKFSSKLPPSYQVSSKSPPLPLPPLKHIKVFSMGLRLWSQSFQGTYMAYYFARAVLTKYHRLGSLNNQNVFAHSSRGWQSETRALTGWISFWGLSPQLVGDHLFPVSSQDLCLGVCASLLSLLIRRSVTLN